MASVFPPRLRTGAATVVRGEGALLWDSDGKRYLDGSGGAVVVNIGHGRREVAEAMARQAQRRRLRPRHAVHERRARGVRAAAGASRARRLRAGSTSSRAAPRRTRRRSSWPARTTWRAASRAAQGGRAARSRTTATRSRRSRCRAAPRCGRPTSRCSPDRRERPAPFCYHCPLDQTYPDCGVACASELEARRSCAKGRGRSPRFIAEPIIGASAGAAVPPDEYSAPRRARSAAATASSTSTTR